MSVNIGRQYRKEELELDGLSAIQDALINYPLETHVVVGIVERTGLNISDRRGTVTPTVRFKWIEVVFDEEMVKDVRNILAQRHEQRLARPPAEDLFSTAATVYDGPDDDDTPE